MGGNNLKKVNLYDLGLSEKHIQESKILDENLMIARVSVQYRDLYKVIMENGEIFAQVSGKMSYFSKDSIQYPAVGDWVLVDRDTDINGHAIIHHILTRKSCFERKIAGLKSDSQIIATNVDTVFICMSLNNDFNIRRLERYIAVAWESMATPVVVLTKSDLCEDIQQKLLEIGTVAMGVDVLVTSSILEEGYSSIQKYIENGRTVAFIGSSGVGKSTLINKLIGEEVLKTNGIRDDHKGKHTTTHRQLFVVPNLGVIIDTPGMRELGIVSADLERSFDDIEKIAKDCKFTDCKHEGEPHCAVREAIEKGDLDIERLKSYKKLQRELKYNELRANQLEREKIKEMFGSKGAMKQTRDFIKNKNSRR